MLWEISLTVQDGKRYSFYNKLNEKGEPITWQGCKYEIYSTGGSGSETSDRGSNAKPSLTVSNPFGLVTGMAKDLRGLVGATMVRRRVYARFPDAANFVADNPEVGPEQELNDRWAMEQVSWLTAMMASSVLATPTETDGVLSPGHIMLASTCIWTHRSDKCGYTGGAVASELDKPTTDIREDRCSKYMRGYELRRNVGSLDGFLSINRLSQ